MSKEATSLQHDMFTGSLVDTRTRKQKDMDARRNDETQMNMFSIQEAPIGVLRTKPIADISNLPSPPLLLLHEDPRTEEEKEADLRREAESLTVNMFVSEPDLSDEDTEQAQRVENTSGKEQATQTNEIQDTKLLAYLGLVQVMEERMSTTWIDESYKQIFVNQLPYAILEAIRSGLNYDEVAAAIKIGQFLGGQKKQVENKAPDKPKKIMIPVEIEEVPKIIGRREGYRKSRRQQQTKFRERR